MSSGTVRGDRGGRWMEAGGVGDAGSQARDVTETVIDWTTRSIDGGGYVAISLDDQHEKGIRRDITTNT
jgi:hypothetical protein